MTQHLLVGPHRFSQRDCWRTLAHANDFLAAYPAGAQSVLARRRDRITSALARIDIDTADQATLQRVLDIVWPELLGAREDVIAAGLQAPGQTGIVEYLHRGDGGVPKPSVGSFDVDFTGVVGDRQATRKHHGSPFQALCVWNLETLDQLANEGHPIEPGSAGENVTISGVDWQSLLPGTRLRIGTVICDISSYAVPCAKNAQWFSDRDFGRIHHDRGPWSRLYATVRVPGSVDLGDEAVVEPTG